MFGLLFLSISVCCVGQGSCLFKNPLCFYHSDILAYLQVLHKNQQYEKMASFIYGPVIGQGGKAELVAGLSGVDFGFALKRVGIIEKGKNKWSITYQRTRLGTQENVKIECALVGDTCRVYLDPERWRVLFGK